MSLEALPLIIHIVHDEAKLAHLPSPHAIKIAPNAVIPVASRKEIPGETLSLSMAIFTLTDDTIKNMPMLVSAAAKGTIQSSSRMSLTIARSLLASLMS